MKQNLIEIKKSKFFGYLFDVDCVEQVNKILQDLKKEHKKSTHICYAYKISKNGMFVKYNDDGEPGGTAGRPIYNVIDKKNMDNVLIVVVRYFGGIKLGAGGLVRAYSQTASDLCKVE